MSSTLKSLKNKKNDGNNNFPPWTHEEKQKFVSGMFNIFYILQFNLDFDYLTTLQHFNNLIKEFWHKKKRANF